MNKPLSLQTRREFLRTSVLGGALASTVPSFLSNTMGALSAAAADAATQGVTGKDGRILVVLQMAGGNDGLNTVVPFANDHYRRARPNLGLGEGEVLRLNDDLGLHPALSGFRELFDAGQLSIVQGVGYPNPNRSHFRSTEIWQTASDADRVERHGWIGRYFDNACEGCDPTAGVTIGQKTPQAFSAAHPTGVTLRNPESYRFVAADHPDEDEEDLMEASYRRMNEWIPEQEVSGSSIGSLSGPVAHRGSALDFIQRTAMDAQLSSDEILNVSRRVTNQADYPASQLGNSLKLVARLIGGGLPTRIYYVSQGGYDTHNNQAGTHQRLLTELGGSLQGFCEDLKGQGNMERVLIMTFSEFGRRVEQNASAGTDHGAAAPLFLINPALKAGLAGAPPSLAPEDLFRGDLQHTVDFRSVYATVLERWLQTTSHPILGRSFPLLDVV
jgi:uncharacterized protein (DUF1501 family)